MPNQYNAYQQSAAYGQPFMNKYPNMYQQQQQQQQQPGKPATGSAASPYGSVSSPYGQQQNNLYNNQQYDDLGMGLNDYQKSMYGNQQQYQGFLGNLNGQQQQPPAQAPTKDTPPQASTPQQQPPVPQQVPYGNYFGQPQIFSYGQYPQYPQQQSRQQQYWNQ